MDVIPFYGFFSLCLSAPSPQAIGTHNGFVHIVDFAGHETKRFAAHTARVNDVSVDAAGEWIASCSDDGMWPTVRGGGRDVAVSFWSMVAVFHLIIL